ncbi:sarcosine oxidase subunit gamma [Castellaniella sp.]|uniref:sarcosine oxidase subunit gamma n=1 Tax=Castellaniella sp. TaxID=1955812 RepID=UPI00355D9E92
MSNEARHHSALAELCQADETVLRRGRPQAVELTECREIELTNLRLPRHDSDARHALAEVLGIPLPMAPNTVSARPGLHALWLSPDEWLLRAGPGPADGWAARIEAALAGTAFFAVTEQSSAYCVLQLAGPDARDVLNAGCPLDLHPRVFGQGQCAQTLFFKFALLLRPLDGSGQAWELMVRRSHADAMARMLLADDHFS